MIVLGLDGATHTLIKPWVDNGVLPNFERLLEDNLQGSLESTTPEITVPAWPAFATGRKPPELDMYGFTHFNRESKENDLSHDTFIPGKMWDVVDDQGGRTVVFNIPGSYPWQPIDGTIIAAAPEYKPEYAHPPERWNELQELVDGYQLRNDEVPGTRAYLALSLELIEKRFDGFQHFIDTQEPQLAVGLIRATDRVAHHFWGSKSIPSTESALFEVYERVDERLGEFLDDNKGEDIVVMSDHGFEKVTAKFAPNHVLEREAFVTLTESGNISKAGLGRARDAASDVLGRLGLLTLARKMIPERVFTNVPTGDALGLDNAISLGRIDWEETTAVAAVGQKTTMIYILTDNQDRIQRVSQRVKTVLRDAATHCGLSVRFDRLDRGGPHTPDLTMVIESPEVHATSRFDVQDPMIDVDTSGHARQGIFAAKGPSFRRGDIDGAHITDVAPTVLHALGYRLPKSMDGEVLDVFKPGTKPYEEDPSTYDYSAALDTNTGQGIGADEEKEGEVKARLRELGYLE